MIWTAADWLGLVRLSQTICYPTEGENKQIHFPHAAQWLPFIFKLLLSKLSASLHHQPGAKSRYGIINVNITYDKGLHTCSRGAICKCCVGLYFTWYLLWRYKSSFSSSVSTSSTRLLWWTGFMYVQCPTLAIVLFKC